MKGFLPLALPPKYVARNTDPRRGSINAFHGQKSVRNAWFSKSVLLKF